MIYLIAPGNSEEASSLVCSALERSCGYGQVQRVTINQWIFLQRTSAKLLSVFINPLDSSASEIIKSIQKPGNKTLLLGSLPPVLAQSLGANVAPVTQEQIAAAACSDAVIYGQADSALRIQYNPLKGFSSPLSSRACLRYDYKDEWNNLGQGGVRADGSVWALSQTVFLRPTNILANLMIGDQVVGAYAGAWFKDSNVSGACLWFNRPVGPIDSQEWRIIEQFISDLGFPECACKPVLSEIPNGYDAAVTMRLDCDEDIESARDLWNAYRAMNVPFSLALHAKVLSDPKHHVLPREVLVHGGALLSHTATHAPNWGGSYEAAYNEGRISADAIAAATGYQVRYAVSPFHHTPVYARSGLADAGYDGCIGGIIGNDYDFMMARSGLPPWAPKGFIGHSQQCMLHGDCIMAGVDELTIFKEAFMLAKASRTFFGYLDHPFSKRYQYGWATESQRIKVHEKFVRYMRQQGDVLFMNESDAMDFFYDRSSVEINCINGSVSYKSPVQSKSYHKQSIEFGGQIFVLEDAEVIL